MRCPVGMQGALLVPMARGIVIAIALVGGLSLLSAGQGCAGDAKNCSNIGVSNYDQSCMSDSDCVAFTGPTDCCPTAAISAAAQARYMSDFAGCGREDCRAACTNRGPCCVNGACEYATVGECRATPPAEDAAADTGADSATDSGLFDAGGG
jgi:hypothetical protein